ncbi:MAG: hypothetical protein AMXMBFR64_47710 [Myxococcales bacterium]
MNQTWRALGPTTLVLLLMSYVLPGSARASCMWTAPPPPLRVVPADGALGIPTNASLWLMARGASEVTVQIDGAEAARAGGLIGWERWQLTGLDAGETVTWSVMLKNDGEEHSYGPFTFQVGASPALAPPKPVLERVEIVSEDEAGTPCDGSLKFSDCIDTGPNDFVRVFVLPADGVILYSICSESPDGPACQPHHLALAGCPATTFVHQGSVSRCFRVQAYNYALASDALVTCVEPGGAAGDATGSQKDVVPASATSSGGCGGPVAPAVALWSALAVLWAIPRARRRPS